MMGLVLLLSLLLLFLGLILLGAAVSWWLRRRPGDSGPSQPGPVPLKHPRDLLPETSNGDGENGLAAFYAYQMAAGKIDRTR